VPLKAKTVNTNSILTGEGPKVQGEGEKEMGKRERRKGKKTLDHFRSL